MDGNEMNGLGSVSFAAGRFVPLPYGRGSEKEGREWTRMDANEMNGLGSVHSRLRLSVGCLSGRLVPKKGPQMDGNEMNELGSVHSRGG